MALFWMELKAEYILVMHRRWKGLPVIGVAQHVRFVLALKTIGVQEIESLGTVYFIEDWVSARWPDTIPAHVR